MVCNKFSFRLDNKDFAVEVLKDRIIVDGHPIYVGELHRDALLNDHFCTHTSPSVNSLSNNIPIPLYNPDSALVQFARMTLLPGLIGAVGLPDIHSGYTFPVGSVAAIDLSHPDASISPSGIGFDINCGVATLRTSLHLDQFHQYKQLVADALFRSIPSGIKNDQTKSQQIKPITDLKTLNGIFDHGLNYLEQIGMISPGTSKYVESNGSLSGNSRLVPQKVKGRGITQLGSLGSGNHYLEIQSVCDIFDDELAKSLGIFIDQIIISIHTGSRGVGHLICNLAGCADLKFNSIDGIKYFNLMNSAANFAWANRAMIAEKTTNELKRILGNEIKVKMVYDTAHNIAKIEKIKIKDKIMEILVHRKGASRVLPAGHEELPDEYKEIGQPVTVGGSMGTNSYILVGGNKAADGWYSACHGAGRLMGRSEAKKKVKYEELVREMNEKGIIFRSETESGLIEEAPCCYKDVDEVVRVAENIGLVKRVAKLKPIIVIKG